MSWGSTPWGAGPWGGGGGVVPADANPIPASGAPSSEEALLGVDIDLLDDLPPTFRLARGPKVLANFLARELITPEGFLAIHYDGDPNYGYDVRGRLNSAWTLQELSAVSAAVEAKCRRHDRVESAAIEVSHDLATSTLSVDITLETAAGPFSFVLNVSAVGVAFLQPE